MPIQYPQNAGSLDFRIRVTQKGNPLDIFIKSIEAKIPNNIKLNYIKNKVLSHLQMYINAHRQRPSEEHTMFGSKEGFRYTLKNNLYNSIEASTTIVKTANGYALTIGEKRFLNTFAPYWYVMNSGANYKGGRFVPPPTVGYFGRGIGPRNGSKGDVFHHSPYFTGNGKYGGNRSYYITPRTFTPMYYLNEMAKVFTIEMQGLADDLKNRTQT
jgi:hypothetical protein